MVIGQMEDIVGFDFVGFIGATIAPLVGNNAVITGTDQRFYLVTPAVGQLGPTVTEHQRNTPLPGLKTSSWMPLQAIIVGLGNCMALLLVFIILAAGTNPGD